MKKTLLTLAALLTIGVAAPAFAENDPSCGNADKATWISKDEMKAKATEMGYDVRGVKVENGCYEVYGIKDGVKLEALFNPATAELVATKTNG